MHQIVQTQPESVGTARTPRHDMYVGIHKALRAWMTDTLAALGRMDADDAVEVAETLARVRGLLLQCRSHLAHENTFIHTAMEVRCPGSSQRIAGEHVGHVQSIEAIEVAVKAVERSPAGARSAAALQLYRQLTLFVADNFQHMHVEETQNNRVLWDAYSDEELAQIHGALVASIPPEEMQLTLRWLIPFLSHGERVGLLAGAKQGMPEEAFQGVLAIARAHLSPRDWAKLTKALGLGTESGLGIVR